MSWAWPILFGSVASVAALLGAGLILALGERAERAAVWGLAFAVGTLLAAASLRLLPGALEHEEAAVVFPSFLAGMVGFFVFERLLRWRHTHHDRATRARSGHDHHHPLSIEPETATMILWGDALHNFVDGLVIGASFAFDTRVGIAVSVAIVAHEIPQEVGDFAVLLASGMKRGRAVLLNWLSAATVLPGTLLAFAGTAAVEGLAPRLLPIAAGGFVYIALADLVPSLHHMRGWRAALVQILLVALGIVAIAAIGDALPHAHVEEG